MVRVGLRELISSEEDLEVVGEAESVSEALRLIQEKEPELVIVDLSLRASSGLDLIGQLDTWTHPPKVLVSSMHDEVLFAERSMREGAWGYINKQESPEELMKAIRCVLQSRIYLSKRMAQRVFERSFRKKDNWGTSPQESLSDRELQVFEMIGLANTTQEIAENLNLSVKTVETYREHIKEKLGLRNSLETVRRAVLWVAEGIVSKDLKDADS